MRTLEQKIRKRDTILKHSVLFNFQCLTVFLFGFHGTFSDLLVLFLKDLKGWILYDWLLFWWILYFFISRSRRRSFVWWLAVMVRWDHRVLFLSWLNIAYSFDFLLICFQLFNILRDFKTRCSSKIPTDQRNQEKTRNKLEPYKLMLIFRFGFRHWQDNWSTAGKAPRQYFYETLLGYTNGEFSSSPSIIGSPPHSKFSVSPKMFFQYCNKSGGKGCRLQRLTFPGMDNLTKQKWYFSYKILHVIYISNVIYV